MTDQTPTTPNYNLQSATTDELNALLTAILAELKSRETAAAPAPKNVLISLTLDGGNSRAGAKSWAKRITGVDPSKGNGYGIEGDFIDCQSSRRSDSRTASQALPEGTLLLLGGSGGSWKNQSRSYALVRVAAGKEFEFDCAYQHFSGTGLELLASNRESDQPDDPQAVIDQHPDLAPIAGRDLFAIYVKLRELGF